MGDPHRKNRGSPEAESLGNHPEPPTKPQAFSGVTRPDCSHILSVAVIRYPDEKQSRREGFVSAQRRLRKKEKGGEGRRSGHERRWTTGTWPGGNSKQQGT